MVLFPNFDPNFSEEDRTYLLNNEIRNLILVGSEPKYGDDGIVNYNLGFLKYTQVYVKTSLSVEKRSCKPFTFLFNGKFETPKIVYQDFSQDFLNINSFFRNYQEAENAKNKYNKCLEDWKSLSLKSGKVIEVQKVCYLGSIFPTKGGPDSTIIVSLIPFGSKLTDYRDWETDRKSTRLNSSHRL